jgi:hypothetical protein
VDWASAQAGDRVSVTVLSTERFLIEPLVRKGYAPDEGGHFFVANHRDLADIPSDPPLPNGFCLSRGVGIAVLRAFRAAGGEQALVYARGDHEYPVPRQVYAALGFRPRGRTVMYRPPA